MAREKLSRENNALHLEEGALCAWCAERPARAVCSTQAFGITYYFCSHECRDLFIHSIFG
ncbi:MAG: hypothetical protein ACE5F4_02420 [Candidatus Paceibacteria bacterium]